MPESGIWHFIQWLHYLALCLWIGGVTFLAGIVAPVVHHSLGSKALAGEIVGKILKRLNAVELGAWLILMFTTSSAFHFIRGTPLLLGYLLILLTPMGALAGFYIFYLTSRMTSIKQHIPPLEMSTEGHAAKIEFDRLHRLYVKLMSLNLVLGMLVLYVSVVVLK